MSSDIQQVLIESAKALGLIKEKFKEQASSLMSLEWEEAELHRYQSRDVRCTLIGGLVLDEANS